MGAQAQRGTWGAGWILFAGFMMMLLGVFQAVAGLTALFNDEFFLVREGGLALSMDFTAWGGLHLILGVVIFLAGSAAIAGKAWGRYTGITLAMISAVANLAFIPAYPAWSILMIVLDVVVIYALAMYEPAA